MLYGYLPASIEVEHELLMQEMDISDICIVMNFLCAEMGLLNFVTDMYKL